MIDQKRRQVIVERQICFSETENCADGDSRNELWNVLHLSAPGYWIAYMIIVIFWRSFDTDKFGKIEILIKHYYECQLYH